MTTASAALVVVVFLCLWAAGAGRTEARSAPRKSSAFLTDSFGDGTPDALRFDSPGDQQAFRLWNSLLAEAAATRPTGQVHREVTDCSALLRFAYREALRRHDAEWHAEFASPLPALPEIDKYSYPETALGASLFRIRPGQFREGDIESGAFAQFADAKTLLHLNTHLVSARMRLHLATIHELIPYIEQSKRLAYSESDSYDALAFYTHVRAVDVFVSAAQGQSSNLLNSAK